MFALTLFLDDNTGVWGLNLDGTLLFKYVSVPLTEFLRQLKYASRPNVGRVSQGMINVFSGNGQFHIGELTWLKN